MRLVTLVLIALAQAAQPDHITHDAYLVYSSLLSNRADAQAGRLKQFVIMDTTKISPCFPSGEALNSSPWKEALESFRTSNAKPQKLSRDFKLSLPHELLSEVQFSALLANPHPDWERFYRSYPDSLGVITFSAVGFNTDRSSALLVAGHTCGTTCGSSQFHFLQKVQGTWQEVKLKDVSTCLVAS